ncbi:MULTISPECIES: TadE/TadG family type IV pilus assembly protein [Comamonas]|uniref:TadE/TadG family type IV pilus assembly protein n=1 Tax=Comamonas TaxID=283 RepID=UPI0001DA6624|nr:MULTISPECIES: TadE family protein [Comamonas]EFI60367.1 TadE family protein [Comamonas thiooxydans]TFF63020.1 pilus assembly protein [Comamonas sp. A23]
MQSPRLSSHRGVALIEFALILPLLLILTFITTEFGRALYQYNTLTKAVRDASRYLSVQDPSIATSDPQGLINNAKNLVVFGNVANTGSPLAVGLSVSQIPKPTWQHAGASPVINTVTIRIAGCATSAPPCYKFTPLISGAFGVNFGTVNFADISATMRAPL